MKKILAVTLAVVTLISVFAIAVFAAEDKEFHVTVNARCNNLDVINFTVSEGNKVQKLLMPPTILLSKPGYEFVGWYNNKTCMPYNFDALVTADVSIYARWQKAGSSPLFGEFDIENIFNMLWAAITDAFARIGSLFSVG